jgi:hypothetical protein
MGQDSRGHGASLKDDSLAPASQLSAASNFATMGLPSSEQWRATCAAEVAGACRNGVWGVYRKPSPRTACGHGRRALPNLGILRPSVDDLQGGFGRTQWVFD